jgi:branched-chain amino acid transport system substrate-binding protein
MSEELNERRKLSRREFLELGAAGTGLLLLAGCGGGQGGGGQGEIVVGSVLDQTGPLNIYGEPMQDSTKLAVADINNKGGVLGSKLKLVSYDAQSANEKYTEFANRLALQDQAVVIMGGITSASREAIRPVIDRTNTLYFYNEQYEGGVCDKNVFCTGVVPSQQLDALIPWAIKNIGPKLYVLAADYNYGHISAEWVKRYAEKSGGEVIGTDFIPLEVADFRSVIDDLQGAQPDVVVSLLVGGNHIPFYRQFASAGLGESMKIVSPTFGLGNEQVVLAPSESQNITVAYPYFQELDNPTNKEFVDRWHKTYGEDYEYITDSAATVWNGWHLWAEAVEKAGGTDKDKVTEALESEITFDGPSGLVKLDGGSHHLIQNVHIAETNENKGFDVIDSQQSVPPSYEQEVCDLIANPNEKTQFTP